MRELAYTIFPLQIHFTRFVKVMQSNVFYLVSFK
jgi:hypothetical protein